MKTALEYFHDGYAAAAKGLPETACPLLFRAWPRDAWLKGHAFQLEFRQAKEPKELVRVDKPPFTQGLIAFNNGIARNDCPYGVDTPEGKSWLEGWDNSNGITVPMTEFYRLAIAAVILWALLAIW